MCSLQEYQHVHLLWFKKRSFTLVWKLNPPSAACTFALVLTRRVKAQWARAAPALHMRRFCAASALLTRAVWNGRKPGSTEALVLKAPLFTWSVKSFSCYNVLRLAVRTVWSRRFGAAQTMHLHNWDHVKFLLAHTQKFGRSLEPCITNFISPTRDYELNKLKRSTRITFICNF